MCRSVNWAGCNADKSAVYVLVEMKDPSFMDSSGVDMPLWMLDTDGAGYYLKLPQSGSAKCTIGFIEKGRWRDFIVKVDYGREQVKGHKYFEI